MIRILIERNLIMKIGIDKIGFAMPNYYLDIRDLAAARGIEPDKFT